MTGSAKIAKSLAEAVSLHQAGRLDEAERLYDKVLKLDRRNLDALNLKGLIESQRGRHAEALALFDRCIAVAAAFPDAHFNKAVALTGLGRGEEALHSYRKAIQLQPAHANARLNAGIVLHVLGRASEAIADFRAMTIACPQDARGFYNLGHCLVKGTPAADESARSAIAQEAVAALTRAQALDPANADVQLMLAEAHALREEYGPAADSLRAALRLGTNWPAQRSAEVMSTLGEHLRKQGFYDAAITTHRQALALSPRQHLIQFNLAAALHDAGRRDEAEALYKDVIAAQPDFTKAIVNLGDVYRDQGRHEEAIALFEKALAIEPTVQGYANIAAAMTDMGWMTTALMLNERATSLGPLNATVRYNRGANLLSMGRFETGWAEHEARFDVADVATFRRPAPEWRGEDLTGKRILVWTEQGLGDQILHGSMIPDLTARAGHVLIECLGRLAPTFARSFPGTTVIARDNPLAAASDGETYDVQIAAGSLGQYLRRSFGDFPRHAGYLKADPAKTERFRNSYEALAAGRRIVGIAWRSRNPRLGANKSTELANLKAILETPGVLFVNLQYGDCAADLAEIRARFGVDIFHDASVDSLVDTDTFFAQVAAMDAVVTTSNSAVHVAGSQNVPTWLLLPPAKGTLWYWFQHRADSPWYPALTLVRAHNVASQEPWEIEPANRIASALARWVAAPQDHQT
ncbi:MAG: tetratricopeptide repeat protein [Proteobacteria bacterium]|nr:tetratricopeptide repeat protein [Pseudomonadota bacterium]